MGSVTVASLAGTGATAATGGTEFRQDLDAQVNRRIPHSAYSAARVPAAHVPAPAGNQVASGTPGLVTGFNGLTHADQRLAGTGLYENTQFSLEPPDQGLCTGGGFVLEAVNTAYRVRSTSGADLSGPIALSQFFGLSPEVVRSTPPVYGQFISDPKCYYDAGVQRWFLTVLELDVDPASGNFTGPTSVLLAVSQSADPMGTWNLFAIDTTNDGTNGTPSHPRCPCFGDQPLIGADANGFYISTNEFPVFKSGFNGAQVYALSKSALAAGVSPPVISLNAGAVPAPDGGIWYTVQPATTPPGGAYDAAAGGTEYFLSSLDFSGTLDNRIAVWSVTNTSSLDTATPDLGLSVKVLDTQVYGEGPVAEQPDGPRPLAAALGIPKEKLELLDSNDDRMNQVVYAAGKLWGAVDTVVKTANGPARAGIAYFIVEPSVSAAGLSGSVAGQGYVAVNRQHVIYPSIGVNPAGKAAIVFTLTGPDYYPSVAYAMLDPVLGAGDVHIAAAGAFPEDGFSGYVAYGGGRTPRTARWGDYSAAVADEDGNLWIAAEYIPNLPRTSFANWGSFLAQLAP